MKVAAAVMITCGLGFAGADDAAAETNGEWVTGAGGCAYLWNAHRGGYEASTRFVSAGQFSYYATVDGARA